jgi:LysM repeat protein
MNKIWSSLLFILVFCSMSFGQIQENIEVINGKKYHIHVADQGNTVYGIHRLYAIPIEILTKENPELENGIQIGQRIKIPYEFLPQSEVIDDAKSNTDKTSKGKVYVIQPRETLFGISRKFDCSIDQIVAANPEVEKGIRIGQEIIIPCIYGESTEESMASELEDDTKEIIQDVEKNYRVNFEDSTVIYTVQAGETLYSISRRFMVTPDRIATMNNLSNYAIKPGDILTIPLKHEVAERYAVKDLPREEEVTDHKEDFRNPLDIAHKESYKIAFLLPLKIKDNAAILSGIIDEKSALNYATEVSLDFYMGVEKALDSLKKLGFNAKVKIIDTQGDEAAVKTIIKNGELDGMDMVFGPFYPGPLAVLADWAKTSKTPLFVPVGAPREVVRNNPYVNILVPSKLTQVGAMARYIAENHGNHNLRLISGRNDEERELVDYFITSYKHYKGLGKRDIVQVGLGSSSGRDLSRTFELDTHNIYICLSENYQHVMQFINTLNAAKNQSSAHGKARVTAFGMREWHNITSLNSYYKNRFELHTPAPLFVDYSDSTINAVVREMHQSKKIDPSRFFFQGFDAAFKVVNQYFLNKENTSGYGNDFNLERIGNNHGKENTSVYIIRQKDYELQLMGLTNHHPTNFKQQHEGED